MRHSKQRRFLAASLRSASCLTAAAFVFAMCFTQPMQAQTYTVIHNFTNGSDGGSPEAGLVMDRAGNLYGTASVGGTTGNGTVFKLTPSGSNWIFSPLYEFYGTSDGAFPTGPLTIGPDGVLYGTTLAGGYFQGAYCDGGCGVVFQLRPQPTVPASSLTPWSETVLIAFNAGDGNEPVYPQLLFDRAGNIYGTTQFGGGHVAGNVFELSPSAGGWTETVLYDGFDGPNGSQPYSGVVMDSAGNLYGTTSVGGLDGVVYEISPTPYGWVETVLHEFDNRGDGGLSYGGLVMDQAGNLYGTTFGDGAYGAGMVFKLSESNGVWSLTDLHDFSFDTEYFPYGAVTIGPNGNLYGTASGGGTYGHGAVWEITP